MQLNNNLITAEMMVHVALCSHPEVNAVAVVNATSEMMDEIKRHGVEAQTFNSNEEVTNLGDDSLDILIINNTEMDRVTSAHIRRILKNDGVVVTSTVDYRESADKQNGQIKLLAEEFYVVMPYRFDAGSAIYASNKYHPTADINLQKADLLDDISYYSAEVQLAGFTLPRYMQKEQTGISRR